MSRPKSILRARNGTITSRLLPTCRNLVDPPASVLTGRVRYLWRVCVQTGDKTSITRQFLQILLTNRRVIGLAVLLSFAALSLAGCGPPNGSGSGESVQYGGKGTAGGAGSR